MKSRAAAAGDAGPQGRAEQGVADEMPSRSMDSKRGPMRTKLGSPAGQGSESGNPSDVPVLSENRAVDLSENRVAGPPRSCRTKCATRAMPSRSMDSKRCPMRTKLGSPAAMGTKCQQTKTQSQPDKGSGGWGKKLHAQRPPGLAPCCERDTTQHLRIHRPAGHDA